MGGVACSVGCSSPNSSPNNATGPVAAGKVELSDLQLAGEPSTESGEAQPTTILSGDKADEAKPPARVFERITEPLLAASPDKIEFVSSTWALAQPFSNGERLGLVRSGTPIAIRSHVVNEDCASPWIEVAPRGFVCMEVRPARQSKKARKKRRRAKRRALLGSYAIAAKGARFYKSVKSAESGGAGRPARGDMLRLGKTVTLSDGTTMRKTDRGEFIATSDIRRLWGSKFAGVDLSKADGANMAFAVHRKNVKSKVSVRREPSDKASRGRSLTARSLVTVYETSPDNEFARIGEAAWVALADLRMIEVREPPVGADGVLRWADIDLDSQVVVIYEGERPVYATLASTGREADRTPTGVFRVTRKKRRTTMRSDRARRQSYSAAVPWSTYFHEGIAFHTAYWHNSFGKARSHGCVNLSPTDAMTVYSLLGPEVPEGWSVVYGHDSQLGSVVQVRSSRPNPVVLAKTE